MNMDPNHFDLLRIAGLKPKVKTEEEKRYPTFNTRMMAATIDMMLISITLTPLVDLAYLQYRGEPPLQLPELIQTLSAYEKSSEAMREFARQVQETGFAEYWKAQMSWHMYVIGVYLILCWHYWSASPGKLLFRLVIVDKKTFKPIHDSQSILRAFGYLLSLMPFGLGFFWMAFDKKKRGFHDLFAGTVVMKKKAVKKLLAEAATSTTVADHPTDSPAPSAGE
jgi:uncharacterized RDD family membrane protein YckC